VANKGTTVKTFESMPRPTSADQFAAWLVPARNNIQREMLRLRPVVLTDPKFDPFSQWVYSARHLVLGACFSLWRSVFQARYEPETVHSSEEARKFLDKIILDNSATFTTELNPWSLAYYVENAVYRLRRCREIAIEAGVDGKRLLGTDLFGELGKGTIINIFGFPETFTPYREWELSLHAVRALISAMLDATKR
jgi:hypothetical protein